MSVTEKDFIPAQPWEQKFGKTIDDRVQWLGQDTALYREDVRFPPIQKEKMQTHNYFIHKLGAEVLQSMHHDEDNYQRERAAMLKRQQAVAKILRKKVKVADLDDGGVSISIEQDWDTSSWNDSQVEAACEALLFIFYDLSGSSSTDRKERAVMMLQKLIQRHAAAEVFLRKNLEMIVSKAVSKLIRKGISGSVLNLLYVLNSCKERYVIELSNFSFNARAMEMLVQEARIAATLIQHTFRCQISKRRLKKQKFEIPGFDTDKEVYYRQLLVINSRSSELRSFWRIMHNHHPIKLRQMIGGMRGPIHVGPTFLDLCLDIVRFLVTDRAMKLAQGNREDVVRSGGCIIMSTLLACAGGKFSFQAALILAEVSKVAESFFQILQSGVISSTVKFLRYMRTVYGVGTAVIKSKKGDKIPIIQAYIAAMDILINTSLHAAGLYRAREKFGYQKKPQNGVEGINYSQVLANVNRSKVGHVNKLVSFICTEDLLKELSTIIQFTQQPTVLSKAMFCLLSLLSSECHKITMLEITALAGVLLIRLLALVHHEDEKTGMLALCIILQLCAEKSDRHALSLVNIHNHVITMNHTSNQSQQSTLQNSHYSRRPILNPLYHNIFLRRSLLLAIILSRQDDWKYYEPEILIADSLNNSAEWTRKAIYLDILQTIKDRNYDGIGIGGTNAVDRSSCTTHPWTIPDLVILPTSSTREVAFSKHASTLNAREICDFLCHPDEEFFYESLPLDEAVGVCAIVEALASFSFTARVIYTSGLVRFLSKFLYLCKYLFLGKPMVNRQVLIVLNGVKSAQIALARICQAIVGHRDMTIQFFEVARATELLNTVLYFMNTLKDFNHKLEPDTLLMQKKVGLSSLEFFTQCTALMNSLLELDATDNSSNKIPQNNMNTQNQIPRTKLEELFEPAKAVIKLLMNLRKIYTERTEENLAEFRSIHDHMCRFLVAITRSRAGAYSAVQEWDIQPTLRYYLPPPLSGIDLIPFTALNQSYSKLGEIVLHQGGEIITGFDEFSSELEKFTKRESQVVSQPMVIGFVYRLELMELPASYFDLCSNLCVFEQGTSFCFMEGFLRRALEKLTILHYQLRQARATTAPSSMHTSSRSQQSLMPIHPNFPWEEKKIDFCSCLRLITKTTNHTQQRYGASNDLILNELYDVVGICCDLIAMKIRRDEEILLLAYELLATLARDTFRIFKLFERFDLFSTVRQEMLSLGVSMPQRGAEALLDIIYHSTLGLTSDYIVKMIPKLREPLIKVARIYSALDDKVRRTNWTLTKSAMLYKNSIDPTFIVEDSVGMDIEEFVRTGSLKTLGATEGFARSSSEFKESLVGSIKVKPQDDTFSTAGGSTVSSSTMKTSEPMTMNDLAWDNLTSSTNKKPKDMTDAELLEDENITIENTEVKAGTYSYCGISNCGSLRFPDQPCDHGTYSKLSEGQAMNLSLKLPIVQHDMSAAESIMPVSKLSAREKELVEMLEYRKGKEGFTEVKKYIVKPFTASSPLKKSKSDKLRKDISDASIYSPEGSKSLKQMTSKCSAGMMTPPPKQIVSISVSEIPDLIMTRPPPRG